MIVSLAKASSFWTSSPCTLSIPVAPRMSMRPARRTLFVMIFAASAMS